MRILFLTRNMKIASKTQEDLLAHHSFVTEFSKQHEVIWWGKLFKNFNENITIPELIKKHSPDIIFKYGFKTPFEKDLEKISIPKIIYLVDYCPPKGNYRGRTEEISSFMKKSYWDLAIIPVTSISDFVKSDAQVKETFVSPFSVDIDMFKKYDIKKDNDVCAMFVSRNDVYPNRNLVISTIKSIPRITHTIGKKSMQKYISTINRSKIFITSNNIFRSMSMKYTECMSCGTFLLADEPDDWELFGYKRDEHFVFYKNMNDLKDKIRYFLKHENEREAIAKNGMDFVRANHNHEVRVQQIAKFIKNRYGIEG